MKKFRMMTTAAFLCSALLLCAEEVETFVFAPETGWEYVDAPLVKEKILFMTYARGTDEVRAFRQRFGVDAEAVPVTEKDGGNVVDLEAFRTSVKKQPALIVISNNTLDKFIPAEDSILLRRYLENGGKLLVFGRGNEKKTPFREWIGKGRSVSRGGEASGEFPVSALHPMTSGEKLVLNEYGVGKGKIFFADGYDVFYLYQAAFLPNVKSITFDTEYQKELSLALTAKIIALVLGTEPFPGASRTVSNTYTVYGKKAGPDYLGERLTVESGKGVLNVRHQSRRENGLQDVRADGRQVFWKADGSGNATVEAIVFDGMNRAVSFARSEAGKGKMTLPEWPVRQSAWRLEVRLLRESKKLDEKQIPLITGVSREWDAREFSRIVWGREDGYFTECGRYRLLKEMGIDAIGVNGLGNTSLLPSLAGLRIVPTNICVPPGRFNKFTFDPVSRNERLRKILDNSVTLSPLGYVIADEPDNAGYVIPFTEHLSKVLKAADPGAKLGFSGVHLKTVYDVPEFIRLCTFMQAYSPAYLYTPDLWRGAERDYLRSFHDKNSILSCWTHYCPWLIHEPYCRTVPWLLLFEEFNGVSLFSSGGGFAILPYDNLPAQEGRWYMEELGVLASGIGRELVMAERDRGKIRIVFPEKVPPAFEKNVMDLTSNLGLALNQCNIPFRFIAVKDTPSLDPKETPLAILPGAVHADSALLENLRRFVESGGVLAAFAPAALFAETPSSFVKPFWTEGITEPEFNEERAMEKTLQEKFQAVPGNTSLFGFARKPFSSGDMKKASAEILSRHGMKTTLSLNGEILPVELSGDIVIPGNAVASVPFRSNPEIPKAYADALNTPAILIRKLGKGKVIYLNFTGAFRTLVPWLIGEAGVGMPPSCRVTVAGKEASNTYLYPFFRKDGTRFLGVVRNYMLEKPVLQYKDPSGAEYYRHGPLRWKPESAVLEIPVAKHVYLPRKGTYLGKNTKFEFPLEPGRPELFALFDEKQTPPVLKSPDKLNAGEIFSPGIGIRNTSLVTLTSPSGLSGMEPLRVSPGETGTRLQVPCNAENGTWLLILRDSVTGLECRRKVDVRNRSVDTPIHPPLLMRRTVDIPSEKGTPWKEDSDSELEKVQISSGKTADKILNYGKYNGKLHRTLAASLNNRECTWQLNYNSCCDSSVFQKGQCDPESELGILRPAPHMFYNNGFFSVKLDGQSLNKGILLESAEAVNSGSAGKFSCSYENPKVGNMEVSFELPLTGNALYCTLKITPVKMTGRIEISFRSYASGFLQPSKTFARTLSETLYRNKWLEPSLRNQFFQMGDERNDLSFNPKGKGAGAIHLIPGEWTKFNPVPPNIEFVSEKAVPAGKPVFFHFAFRIFPGKSNADAWNEIRDTDAEVREYLNKISSR